MEVLTDSAGRKIEVKLLTPGERYNLTKVIGSGSDVTQTMMNALLAVVVRSIDGVPVPFPTREPQIPATLDRLDHHGIAAVTAWLEAKASGLPTSAEAMAEAKN